MSICHYASTHWHSDPGQTQWRIKDSAGERGVECWWGRTSYYLLHNDDHTCPGDHFSHGLWVESWHVFMSCYGLVTCVKLWHWWHAICTLLCVCQYTVICVSQRDVGVGCREWNKTNIVFTKRWYHLRTTLTLKHTLITSHKSLTVTHSPQNVRWDLNKYRYIPQSNVIMSTILQNKIQKTTFND